MAKLLALDVAVLLPAETAQRAVDLSAALPEEDFEGLRLDADHRPHLTLTQQFVREEELDAVFEHVDASVRGRPPLRIHVTGAAQEGRTISLAVERTAALDELHGQLMEALRGLERPGGTPAAFVGEDGRVGDVLWVSGFRLKSSFGSYAPHITLGHGAEPPAVEPFVFDATTVAACHLGRFCTCRTVLRQWLLR
jgi:2'-5' RNA ligase